MINTFCKTPLWECSQTLAKVASGIEKAELVIKNVKLINVCTREILENIDVAVSCGRIAYVGANADYCIGENTQVVDGTGKYLAPALPSGFI